LLVLRHQLYHGRNRTGVLRMESMDANESKYIRRNNNCHFSPCGAWRRHRDQ
ncbi:hypothetical protein FRC12_024187, partial [Ceratobasidium sp. 428]